MRLQRLLLWSGLGVLGSIGAFVGFAPDDVQAQEACVYVGPSQAAFCAFGAGEGLPANIAAAGMPRVFAMSMTETIMISVDTAGGRKDGEPGVLCSTEAMSPFDSPHVLCSAINLTDPPSGTTMTCTSYQKVGGSLTVSCSSRGSGAGTVRKCSVTTGSSSDHECSVDADASNPGGPNGSGTAYCSAEGNSSEGNGGAECSVTTNSGNGDDDSCSTGTPDSSGGQTSCSTRNGGDQEQQCSVAAGSGAECTTGTSSSGGATCSAESGTNTNCSTWDGNAPGGDNGPTNVGAFTGTVTGPDSTGQCK